MAETEKSKEIEEKFKLSLLQTEKRIVDLEMLVSELKEKLKDIDLKAVSELRERVEELEDLVMVENAGVIELKKMLEDLGSRIETAKPVTPEIPADLSEKIRGLEERLSSLPQVSIVEENIKSLVESVKSNLTSKIVDLEKKVEEVNKFASKTAEIEKEIAFIEEKLKTPVPELFVKDIENIKSSLLVNSAKVDAVEKFVSSFAKEIEEIKPTIQKFETLEKIDEVNRQTEERLKELKLTEERVEELRKFVEPKSELIKKIEEKVKLIEGMEEKLSGFDGKIKAIRANVIEQVLSAAESLAGRMQVLEGKTNAIKSDIDKSVLDIRSRSEELDKVLARHGERIEEIKNSLSSQVKTINERIGAIEKIKHDLERRIEEIAKVPVASEMKEVEELKRKMEDLSSRVMFIEENYRKGLENIQAFVSPINAQIMEIVDRLVFLETRIVALENMLQETSKALPVIIE